MTLRDWTDLRDGRRWSLRLRRGSNPVLVFSAEAEVHTAVVHFNEGLEDRSDEELQRLLDEGKGARDGGGSRTRPRG